MSYPSSVRKYGLIWLLPALLLVTGFVWLGLWQLDRAEQKRDILQQIETADALALHELTAASASYSLVSGNGHYLPFTLLLDNQVHNSRQGVHVLTPLLLDDARLLLVNRGWLPLPPDRRKLPLVATPDGEVAISGRVTPLPGVGLRLGEQPALDLQQWPQLLTYVDAELLQQGFRALLDRADVQLLPLVLKLDAEAEHGFAGRDWALLNFGPDKHTAYALQWFSLALMVLATFVILSLRRARRLGRSDASSARQSTNHIKQ